MTAKSETIATGSCLCGAVRYAVHADIRPSIRPCHCTQCRKQSGHYMAYAQVLSKDGVTVEGEENVTWYRASDTARRGFCRICGSQLFWAPDGRDQFDVSGGTLDSHPPLHLSEHIFVADKGDYYDLNDGLPQHDAYPGD